MFFLSLHMQIEQGQHIHYLMFSFYVKDEFVVSAHFICKDNDTSFVVFLKVQIFFEYTLERVLNRHIFTF